MNYDIEIDWVNNATVNNIDFAIPRVQKLLSNINPNKACGPDGIYEKILVITQAYYQMI